MPDATAGVAARPLAVLILAAGRGARMKSRRPKVLHEVAGLPLLAYPLALAEALSPARLLTVVAPDATELRAAFAGRSEFALQSETLGTGDAVRVALAALNSFAGDVLILCGDCPLLRAESLARLLALRVESEAPLLLLTAPAPLPGLVERDADGRVLRIIERSDATPGQRELEEGYSGVMLADAAFLQATLGELDRNNAQGEFYLTGVVEIAHRKGQPALALQLEDADEALGVNDRVELSRANALQFRRNAEWHMKQGVTFLDPQNSYVDSDVVIGRDTSIGPGVVITAGTRIGERALVKAHSVIEASRLGDDVVIGPSAHLRPESVLGDGVRIGNFVEVKNSRLGPGVKADHLAYLGDADIGADASFGCGAITVNYDWQSKHRTTVGARARIGCNANLVAPVELEADSFVAAGVTVTRSVPSGALAKSSSRQQNREGWAEGQRRARAAADHADAEDD